MKGCQHGVGKAKSIMADCHRLVLRRSQQTSDVANSDPTLSNRPVFGIVNEIGRVVNIARLKCLFNLRVDLYPPKRLD